MIDEVFLWPLRASGWRQEFVGYFGSKNHRLIKEKEKLTFSNSPLLHN